MGFFHSRSKRTRGVKPIRLEKQTVNDDNVLSILVDSRDWQIRNAIAEQKNTPRDYLEKLLKDKFYGIRSSAQETLTSLVPDYEFEEEESIYNGDDDYDLDDDYDEDDD